MPADSHRPRRFALILVPGFTALGLALVTEPLFIANWIAGRRLFAWTTLSADGLAVASSAGAAQPVDAPLGQGDAFDTVLVVASFEARAAAADRRLLHWLRRQARRGAEIGAVETGSEVLAAAGLLPAGAVPVHWYNRQGFAERHPEASLADARWWLGGGRAVSAGGTATLDLMLALIAREAGAPLAAEVARHLLVAGPRPADERQPGPEPAAPPAPACAAGDDAAAAAAADPVERARALMRAHLAEPLACAEIARRAGLSARQLQRIFRARTGATMRRTYLVLRMERAHQLVQQTDLSVTEIAVACGFAASESFSRCYRAFFGVAPSRDRRQGTDTSVFSRARLEPGTG
jgi:AraC family carnitine catabolism transcriptional activator